jgi:outer membrane protein
MPLRRTILLGALLASGLAHQGAQAQQQPAAPIVSADGNALSGLTAAQLFEIADQARAAGRNPDAEAIYKALSADPKAEIRNEARFRLGMMYADEKKFTESALAFRAILDEQPEAARVRLELARVLATMGEEGKARQELRQAQASGLPPQVALVVDQFAAALRSNKVFGGSFEFALAPDSNINRATSLKTLDTVIAPLTLSEDARSQSGVGAHVSTQIYARLRLSNRFNLVPRLSGDGTFYKASQFNDLSGSTLLGLEWQIGPGDRLITSGGYTYRTYGGDPYARTATADVRWTHRLGRRAQLDSSFSYGNSSYSRNALQDGELFNLSTTLERAITARTGIALTLNGLRQTAVDPAYATTSGSLTLVGWRDLGKTTLFLNGTVRRLESDAAISLFPDRRKEWFGRRPLRLSPG